MSEPPQRQVVSTEQIRTLAKETGVSDDEIRLIMLVVGKDRASILREARYLKETRRS